MIVTSIFSHCPMTEDIIFKRRNRLKKHFVNTSNVLLYCYKAVSAEAKITYQVVDSFDWEEKETGESKGYVFPAVETLADIRGASIRTIQRHIKELEQVGLLTRQRRNHQASILFIEDVSEQEAAIYLETYVHKTRREQETQKPNDKNVVLLKGSQTTKMAVAYMKENEMKENEMNVNEHVNIPDEKKRSGLEGIRAILRRFDTINPKATKRAKQKAKPDESAKRDYYAQHLAEELQDQKSLGCFRVIAQHVPQPVIFEALAAVKDAWKAGKIRKSRGALFVDLIKAYCHKHRIDLGFQYAGS